LNHLSKAKDIVQIVTTDIEPEAPNYYKNYPIYYSEGGRLSCYPSMIMTTDMKDRMIYNVMKPYKPDLIHATSPTLMTWMTMWVAKWLKIPFVASYHTHLPVYAKMYLGFIPGIEQFAWFLLNWGHNRVDLTLCTSPQIKEQLEAHGL
jgi:glycosyltransferase involved in cell wall biosynthesis